MSHAGFQEPVSGAADQAGGPLAGVRVVEAGIALAGPFCGSLLADFGACVVKVERPDGGDPARLLGPGVAGVPLWWGVASRDKRCVALDLKDDRDRERFLALVDDADVLVENYRPGVMERLGLGWEVLSARNPRLVMMSISGFGHTGPDARRPGFGKIAEAVSGIVAVTGSPQAPPLHVGFSLADTSAGLMGCLAVNMALLGRERNGGRGARIDIGLYEPLLRMMELQFALRERTGAPCRTGSNDPYGWGGDGEALALPAGRRFVAATCADGAEILVRVDAAAAAAITSLAASVPSVDRGRPAQAAAPAETALAAWTATVTADEAAIRLREAGIEAARVHDGRSLGATRYFVARGDVVAVDDPQVGRLMVPGRVPRDRGRGQPPAFHAPRVGEHDAVVFPHRNLP